jgi:hypothetical protein
MKHIFLINTTHYRCMVHLPIKRLLYGEWKDHEKELSFPSVQRHSGAELPDTVVIGSYKISFTGKVFGGYEANIVRTDGVVVARGAKVSRFSQKQYLDPETDTFVYIKLSLVDGATLIFTAFDVAEPLLEPPNKDLH